MPTSTTAQGSAAQGNPTQGGTPPSPPSAAGGAGPVRIVRGQRTPEPPTGATGAQGASSNQAGQAGNSDNGSPSTPQLSDEKLKTLVQSVAQELAQDLVEKSQDAWRSEFEALKTRLEESQKEIAEYREFMRQLAAPEPTGPTPGSYEELQRELQHPPAWVRSESDRKLWESIVERDFKSRQMQHALLKEVEEMRKTLEHEAEMRKKAEEERRVHAEARREADRRSILAAIAAEIDAVDAEAVRRYFSEDLAFDDKTQRFRFRLPNGKLIDVWIGNRINPEILAAVPEWLRRPLLRSSGSGAHGGSAPQPSPADELREAREEAQRAFEAARTNPNNQAAIAEYAKARRKLLELERRVKAA